MRQASRPGSTGTLWCLVSCAVVYGGSVHLVDLGHGAMHRLVRSGPGAGGGLGSAPSPVRGVLLTHLHGDHVADEPALFAMGPADVVGRGTDVIRVFGPGDRGVPSSMFPPGAPAPAVFNPERPTPGITAMTTYLGQAFACRLQRTSERKRLHPPRRPEAGARRGRPSLSLGGCRAPGYTAPPHPDWRSPSVVSTDTCRGSVGCADARPVRLLCPLGLHRHDRAAR
ncbi:MBL fold metallo-hydrolase [Streptomyces sp. NPDC049590]|uniref:MBL fold metallo-hydrolase n=1 Tax=Streptomyces sp. NPDC049590 TaxID=3154834 RepID=UPI00342A6DB2